MEHRIPSPADIARRLLLFAPPVLIGFFLRLHGWTGQVLLDDEWHSLNFVLDKSFFAVCTTHGIGANCIPQNIFNWILLHTVGWSEITLGLPSVCCGILGLLLFPWLVSRLAGRTPAIFFAYLFALSPCVTFYSLLVRPYSMVLFFGFLSLLCLALWVREGQRRLLLAYALFGFVSMAYHLYAALAILPPLGALFLLSLFSRKPDRDAPWISAKVLIGAGGLMAVLLLVFLGPAHWQNPWWLHVQGLSRVTRAGGWEFLSLLAGTHLWPLKLAFAILVGLGLRQWLEKEFRIGLLFLSTWAMFFALLMFATQDGMHAAIQLARYNILLFPVSMVLAATALDGLLSRLPSPSLRIPLGIGLIALLLFGSPAWRTHAQPNNFMNHSAFQDSYEPFDWSRSRIRRLTPLPQMPRERIPSFYDQVAADSSVPGLIEYPMQIGDPLNFHYFYQHVHRKPVAIGYVPDFPFSMLPTRNEAVYQTTPLDYVFSRAQSLGLGGQMRFANLLPLTDPARWLPSHHGWLLVLHRDIQKETIDFQLNTPDARFLPPVMLPLLLNASWGPPVHTDAQLMVWRIP